MAFPVRIEIRQPADYRKAAADQATAALSEFLPARADVQQLKHRDVRGSAVCPFALDSSRQRRRPLFVPGSDAARGPVKAARFQPAGNFKLDLPVSLS